MLTSRKLEQIAKAILENSTLGEIQRYLDMDHNTELLWIKYKIASLEEQA